MKSRDDEGISTIEALVAIAILAIAGVALLGGASGAMAALVKAKNTARITSSLLRTDSLLREKIGNIRIPFWEQKTEITVPGESAEIPWYDGKKDHLLKLYIKEGTFIIETVTGETSETTALSSDIEHIDIKPILKGDKVPEGLDIGYTIKGKAYRTLAAFASAPLEKALP